MLKRIIGMALLPLLLSACTGKGVWNAQDAQGVEANAAVSVPDNRIDVEDAMTKVTVACPEPRPFVCSADYTPVCANVVKNADCNGSDCEASVQKTYSNACTACTYDTVVSYVKGGCPGDENPALDR